MDYNTTYTGIPACADGMTMDMFNHEHNHRQYPPHVPLQHNDFIPECISSGSVLSDKKFERFDILMQRANEWLRNRPYLKVVTCESIEVKKRSGDHGEIDTEKVTYYEYGEYRNKFIRALRLWCCSRHEQDPKGPSQISHFNIIPSCLDPGGVFSNPKYESFNVTLDKVNEELRRRPLPGRIINLETQDMKFHTSCDSVDPDETYWTEAGKTGTYFLNIIRIFYEVTIPGSEEIGCADFVPEILQQGGIITTAKFEPFASVVAQARCWIAQQHNIKIVSIQSIDYKLKSSWSGDGLDTHRTMFYERGEGFTYYLRILRVSYTRSHSMENEPLLLNYKTFIPVQLTRDAAFTTPKFETISETVKRANAWLTMTGVPVVSSETVPIRLYSGNQHGDSEQTYTWNHGDRNETWLHVMRVYLNGDYEEPPAESLPAVPPLDEDECDCCAVS